MNTIAEARDYPLEIRLQVMFRIWSFALFYSLFLPYMMFELFLAFVIIYWVEKHNVYKHYTIRRKVSINLEAEFLILFIIFFCIFQCTIYCLSVTNNIQIIVAICVTFAGIIGNTVYWVFLHSRYKKVTENIRQSLVKESEAEEEGKQFEEGYSKFLSSISNS